MISCYLSGGLGNQLFQIFTTMAYCMQHNLHFVFPYEKDYMKEKNRPTYWENFLYHLKPHTTKCNSITNNEILNYKIYPEPKHTFVEIPQPEYIQDSNGNAIFKGFFQSPIYFHSHFEQICDYIGLDKMRDQVLNEYKHYNTTSPKISMHLRLGDYKNIKCYHPVMPWEYYNLALKHIVDTRQLNNIPVVVYCFTEREDEAIMHEYINKIRFNNPSNISFVLVSDIDCDWKQMLFMSACDDNIIANSTFSWWGALFNKNKNKIVCYPCKWYGHQLYYIDNTDLFPDSWTKISLHNIHVGCNCNK
jgi:hypothetical protein